jgi:hypothetical protein
MKRHPFRWDALIFGLVFLAVVGTWLVHTAGLLTSGQLAYALAAALIAVGVAGIVASMATPEKRFTPRKQDVDEPVATNEVRPSTGREPEPRTSSSH